MRILFIIFVAVVAFAAGVWYMGGFESPTPQPIPTTSSPTTTPVSSPTTTAVAIYHNADASRIRVDAPRPGSAVAATFDVTGEAVGGWYFEANFPYEVRDADGNRLVQGPVQAKGEWMTPSFVPFSFQVTVPNYIGAATLVLHNDNPSGLPENAASISIPITIR